MSKVVRFRAYLDHPPRQRCTTWQFLLLVPVIIFTLQALCCLAREHTFSSTPVRLIATCPGHLDRWFLATGTSVYSHGIWEKLHIRAVWPWGLGSHTSWGQTFLTWQMLTPWRGLCRLEQPSFLRICADTCQSFLIFLMLSTCTPWIGLSLCAAIWWATLWYLLLSF